MFNNPLLIDQKSDPAGAHVLTSHKLFQPPDTVRLNNLFVRIGNKTKRELILLRKLFVPALFINTDTEYLYSHTVKFR